MRTRQFDTETINGPDHFQALFDSSQANCSESVGEILNACRAYLLAIADAAVSRDLAGKIAPSDIVQEPLLEAHQRLLRGLMARTHEELLAWLRCILKNNLLNSIRRFRETASRRVSRECGVSGGSTMLNLS